MTMGDAACSARVLNRDASGGGYLGRPLGNVQGSQIYRNPWDVLTHLAHYLHARVPLARAPVSRVPPETRPVRFIRGAQRAARVVALS